MERKITSDADALTIRAHGEPNAAGAVNRYLITQDPRALALGTSAVLCDIRFQNGHPDVHGTNGVTMEALMAVVADRLACLQEGQFPCDENAAALVYLHCAAQALANHTRRLARGVEGKLAA
jgi:hypothetical protein